jgi:hypothetical protein
MGMNFVAFEIDHERAAMARERVAHAPLPLFVLQPAQAALPW